MSVFDRLNLRLSQIVALLFVPFIIVIGMLVIPIFHDITTALIPSDNILEGFLASMLSLVAFVGLVWFAYFFTTRGGIGVFKFGK